MIEVRGEVETEFGAVANLFVLGCGRSGTSLVASLFAKAGFWMGDSPYKARDANPLGFFEDAKVNQINENILLSAANGRPQASPSLLSFGRNWLARIPIETPIEPRTSDLDSIALATRSRPFCFKDPRFCYTLAAWRQSAGRHKCICVIRNPAAVVTSILKECQTAKYLQGVIITTEEAFKLWRLMYRHVLSHHSCQGDWLFVPYEKLFASDALDRIQDFTEVRIDRSMPDIRYNRSKPEIALDLRTRRLYDELLSLT